jgi:hypothetical protein
MCGKGLRWRRLLNVRNSHLRQGTSLESSDSLHLAAHYLDKAYHRPRSPVAPLLASPTANYLKSFSAFVFPTVKLISESGAAPASLGGPPGGGPPPLGCPRPPFVYNLRVLEIPLL